MQAAAPSLRPLVSLALLVRWTLHRVFGNMLVFFWCVGIVQRPGKSASLRSACVKYEGKSEIIEVEDVATSILTAAFEEQVVFLERIVATVLPIPLTVRSTIEVLNCARDAVSKEIVVTG